MAGWTVAANTARLSKALNKYAKQFNVDLGKLIRYTAVGLMKDIMNENPVDTGRSRAGWMPFLIDQHVPVRHKSSPTAKTRGKTMQAQREGLASGTFKYKFTDTSVPYFWAQNAVHYVPYLEYGIRKGRMKKVPKMFAIMSPVSKQANHGFVRRAMAKWQGKLRAAMRTGTNLKRGL